MFILGMLSALSSLKPVAMEFKGGNETPGWKLEWDAISDMMWECLWGILISKEDDDDSGDDMLFTPLKSPSRLDPAFEVLCLCKTWGFQRVRVLTQTKRVLQLHHFIVGQLIDAVEGSRDLAGSIDSSLQ